MQPHGTMKIVFRTQFQTFYTVLQIVHRGNEWMVGGMVVHQWLKKKVVQYSGGSAYCGVGHLHEVASHPTHLH